MQSYFIFRMGTDMIQFNVVKKWALWHLALNCFKITPSSKVSRNTVPWLKPSTKAQGQIGCCSLPCHPFKCRQGVTLGPLLSSRSIGSRVSLSFSNEWVQLSIWKPNLCCSRWAKSCLSHSLKPCGALFDCNEQDLALILLPEIFPLDLNDNGEIIVTFIWCEWS